MEGKRNSRHRVIVVGLLSASAFTILGFTVAAATIPAADGTVTFCYAKSGGAAHIIDPSVRSCKSTERSVNIRTYDPIYANVAAIGTLGSNKHTTGVVHTAGSGIYKVSFDRSVNTCGLAATATLVPPGSTESPLVASATPGPNVGDPASEVVVTIENPHYLPGNKDGDFSLTITC